MSDQPRIVPTRPGWWFVETDEGAIEAVEICEFGGVLKYVTALGVGHVDQDDLEWLAPIPVPAVLAALAEYGEAVRAWRRNTTPVAGGLVSDALRALDIAILAERDGGA